MIGVSNPICSSSDINISSCIFTDKQLMIIYSTSSGDDESGAFTISISNFKNPVEPGQMSGFSIFTTDE